MAIRSLVVDDFPMNRMILHKYLSVLGTVHDADEGLSGVERFEQALRTGQAYDLVCLDINMPGINGFEVLSRMRDLEEEYSGAVTRKSTILMVSAHSGKEQIMLAIERSDGFIVKPITRDVLYAKLIALGFDVPAFKTVPIDLSRQPVVEGNKRSVETAGAQFVQNKAAAPVVDLSVDDDLFMDAAASVMQMDMTDSEEHLMPDDLPVLELCDGQLCFRTFHDAQAGAPEVTMQVIRGAWVACLGESLKACSVGEGLEVDKKGICLRALCSGQLVLERNVLKVESALTLGSGLLPSDIRFVGDIRVDGDLPGGQTIHAGKDVRIKGIMGNSCIISDGEVQVYRLHGAEKGEIRAAGNVKAEAVYNARIESEKDIHVEGECIGSNIFSLGRVDAGTITGGKCIAKACISVNRAGAAQDVTTILMAGIDYRVEEQLVELKANLRRAQDEVRRLEQLVGPRLSEIKAIEGISSYAGDRQRTFVEQLIEKRAEQAAFGQDIEDARRSMVVETTPSIDVAEVLFEGVVIQLGSARVVTAKTYHGGAHVHLDQVSGRILFEKRGQG